MRSVWSSDLGEQHSGQDPGLRSRGRRRRTLRERTYPSADPPHVARVPHFCSTTSWERTPRAVTACALHLDGRRTPCSLSFDRAVHSRGSSGEPPSATTLLRRATGRARGPVLLSTDNWPKSIQHCSSLGRRSSQRCTAQVCSRLVCSKRFPSPSAQHVESSPRFFCCLRSSKKSANTSRLKRESARCTPWAT